MEAKGKPEYAALLLNLDNHAPNDVRANRQIMNHDGFYKAYEVKEGDKMYLTPEDRVKIW